MKKPEVKKTDERRRHERYKACDGSFAAVSANSFKLGQIINISRGGLAFQYIDTHIDSLEKEENRIFLSSKEYYVRGIPFKPVSDLAIPNENPYSNLTMRQCAIQFESMTMEQMIKLDNYILNNTENFIQP
ncbi:MAG: PilZ domain-containing protein [Desulfamplus sp.]|nr:PilZ domain-containing protein [Desulfamplus sp.]